MGGVAVRRVGPGTAAPAVAAALAEADPETRLRAAGRLAGIAGQSWDDLIELIGGCGGGRAGRELASSVVARLDGPRLEKECLRRWAAGQLPAAKSVLVRHYGYDPAAIT